MVAEEGAVARGLPRGRTRAGARASRRRRDRRTIALSTSAPRRGGLARLVRSRGAPAARPASAPRRRARCETRGRRGRSRGAPRGRCETRPHQGTRGRRPASRGEPSDVAPPALPLRARGAARWRARSHSASRRRTPGSRRELVSHFSGPARERQEWLLLKHSREVVRLRTIRAGACIGGRATPTTACCRGGDGRARRSRRPSENLRASSTATSRGSRPCR